MQRATTLTLAKARGGAKRLQSRSLVTPVLLSQPIRRFSKTEILIDRTPHPIRNLEPLSNALMFFRDESLTSDRQQGSPKAGFSLRNGGRIDVAQERLVNSSRIPAIQLCSGNLMSQRDFEAKKRSFQMVRQSCVIPASSGCPLTRENDHNKKNSLVIEFRQHGRTQ